MMFLFLFFSFFFRGKILGTLYEYTRQEILRACFWRLKIETLILVVDINVK